MESALSCQPGFLQLELLQHVRSLTIPDKLPEHLRPLLGKWLRATGRLSRVGCVRCQSWIRPSEIIPWIDLAPVRAGEDIPERHAVTLDRYDTADGLLKTVLEHAQTTIKKGRLVYCCVHASSAKR